MCVSLLSEVNTAINYECFAFEFQNIPTYVHNLSIVFMHGCNHGNFEPILIFFLFSFVKFNAQSFFFLEYKENV